MSILREKFADGTSVIHKIAPHARLASAAFLSFVIALVQTQDVAWLALLFSFSLVALARLKAQDVFYALLPVNLFVGLLWLFLPLSTPGTPLFSFGFLTISADGLRLALLLSCKSNAVTLIVIALISTISIRDLGTALQSLRVPAKFCHILLFTHRYIFVIHAEYKTMLRAMRARGFLPHSDLHTYKSYAWLVGMLLIRSWDRAERVHKAMLCRGFSGRFHSLAETSASTTDYLFVFILLLISIAVEGLDIYLQGTL